MNEKRIIQGERRKGAGDGENDSRHRPAADSLKPADASVRTGRGMAGADGAGYDGWTGRKSFRDAAGGERDPPLKKPGRAEKMQRVSFVSWPFAFLSPEGRIDICGKKVLFLCMFDGLVRVKNILMLHLVAPAPCRGIPDPIEPGGGAHSGNPLSRKRRPLDGKHQRNQDGTEHSQDLCR